MKKIFKTGIFFLFYLLFLNSCLGLSMDIQMRRDGSGKVVMEYIIPAAFENLGRLDGNQNWPVVPVGRADWERSVSRIGGLRLSSYSFRERGNDYIINATVDFDNPETLEAFIGTNASVNSGSLEIKFIDSIENQNINSDLLELIAGASSGKKIALSFSYDAISSLTVTDGEGNAAVSMPSAQIIPEGKKVSFSVNTGELFSQTAGIGVKITWPE